MPLPLPAARSSASITIKIPHRDNAAAIARYLSKTPSAGNRSRHYVSPATQSITIAVTDSSNTTTTTNASLTVTPAGSGPNPVECTSGALSTLCTITLALTPGSYTASFTTYDGPLDSGTGMPTGNKLSQNQNVPFTVVSGKSNQLIVSLAAIPAGVSIVPAFNEKLVRGNETDGFSLLITGQTHTFNVEAYDADGDAIVGPGAPTWSTDLEGGSVGGFLSVQVPTTANPNTFTFQTMKHLSDGFPKNPQSPSSVTIALTAVPPAGAGATCSAATCTRTVGFDSLDLFYASFANRSGIYVAGDVAPLVTSQISAQTSVTDAAGNVYFGSFNNLYKWSPPYDQPAVEIYTNSDGGNLQDLTFDPSGIMYYEAFNQTDMSACVYQLKPPYTTSTNILCGFAFRNTLYQQSRLLADSNGRIIVADDNDITIIGTDLSHQQSISGADDTLLLDKLGELIVSDDPTQTLTPYAFDTNTGTYVATGNANTNKPAVMEALSPMRNDGSSFIVPLRQESEIAIYAVPLTNAAPAIVSVPPISLIDDFQLIASGRGLAGLDGHDTTLSEAFNFGVGEVNVTAPGSGTPDSISDIP